mgnify:CR=1 FL=1
MNISSKELKKMARNQLSGKYGTFIGTNVLYILITLVASNLMDLVLGTCLLYTSDAADEL